MDHLLFAFTDELEKIAISSKFVEKGIRGRMKRIKQLEDAGANAGPLLEKTERQLGLRVGKKVDYPTQIPLDESVSGIPGVAQELVDRNRTRLGQAGQTGTTRDIVDSAMRGKRSEDLLDFFQRGRVNLNTARTNGMRVVRRRRLRGSEQLGDIYGMKTTQQGGS